jgi:hypothetical protein
MILAVSNYYKISTDNVIEFTVKDSTPDNSIIPIKVTMVDETGNTWTSNFNLQVLPFKIILVYDGHIINSENNEIIIFGNTLLKRICTGFIFNNK